MGREVRGGFRMGNTCMPIADSCWCVAESIQYCRVKPPIKINKFKNKIKSRCISKNKNKKSKWGLFPPLPPLPKTLDFERTALGSFHQSPLPCKCWICQWDSMNGHVHLYNLPLCFSGVGSDLSFPFHIEFHSKARTWKALKGLTNKMIFEPMAPGLLGRLWHCIRPEEGVHFSNSHEGDW